MAALSMMPSDESVPPGAALPGVPDGLRILTPVPVVAAQIVTQLVRDDEVVDPLFGHGGIPSRLEGVPRRAGGVGVVADEVRSDTLAEIADVLIGRIAGEGVHHGGVVLVYRVRAGQVEARNAVTRGRAAAREVVVRAGDGIGQVDLDVRLAALTRRGVRRIGKRDVDFRHGVAGGRGGQRGGQRQARGDHSAQGVRRGRWLPGVHGGSQGLPHRPAA
jgi:hypothetical protein